MPLTKGHNLVTFTPVGPDGTPEDVRLSLGVEGEWVMSAGLEPNINAAVVSYKEFDKLGGVPGRRGRIEFWYRHAPGEKDKNGTAFEPDHRLEGQRIVDVEPLSAGSVQGDAEGAVRVLEWRLFFADFREAWVPPRGGRLSKGIVNPRIVVKRDGVAPAEKTLAELIDMCLVALKPSARMVSEEVNAIDVAPKDLMWFAASAREELGKLLEHCHAALCPTSSGGVVVELLGSGEEPDVPEDRLVTEIPMGGIDRRGKTILFVSAAMSLKESYDENAAAGQAPSWQLVVPDANGDWVTLDSLLGGRSLQDAVRSGFAFLPTADRERVLKYALRCLRLDPSKFPASEQQLLRLVMKGDGTSGKPMVYAKIAVKDGEVWRNSEDQVKLPVEKIDQQHNVIVVADTIGRVDADTPDKMAKFVPLAASDLRVRFSVATLKQSLMGFRKELSPGEGVQPLDDDEAKAAFDGAGDDVVIVPVPWLDLATLNGEDTPQKANMLAKGRLLAERYLAGSGNPPRQIIVKGFWGQDPTGRIREIRWDQSRLWTVMKVDSWWVPKEARTKDRLLNSGSFPMQAPSEASRMQLGEGASARPACTVNAVPSGDPPSRTIEEGFWSVISGSLQDGANKRWAYGWAEIEKTAAGYAGWAAKAGGRSGTPESNPLYNSIEYGNAAAGVYHNGVDAANLVGTFVLKPIPDGTVVWVRIARRTDGSTEYWTSFENAVDGGCG